MTAGLIEQERQYLLQKYDYSTETIDQSRFDATESMPLQLTTKPFTFLEERSYGHECPTDSIRRQTRKGKELKNYIVQIEYIYDHLLVAILREFC